MSDSFKTRRAGLGYFCRYGMDPAEHLLLLDRPPVGSPGRAQAPGAARFEASTAPFQVTVVPVLAELRRHVASVWVVEGCAGDPARPPALDVLPGTLATLCVTYGSRVEHAGATAPSAVCGLFTRTRSYVPWPAIGVVMVAWKPGALRRFVPLPADEIAGVNVRAEVVWGGALSGLEDRVAGAPDAQARGLLVQRFLLEHPAPAGWDPLAAHVAEAIVGAGGNVSVAALAAGAGLSERQLERRFSAAVGVRPKRFARLARFDRALSLSRSGLAWAQVAAAAGFSDQSHLAREFLALVGAPPESFARLHRVPTHAELESVRGVSDSFNRAP